MIRRVTYAFVVTLALLGALISPTAPAASAATVGSCSISVPSTVWVASVYTKITAQLGADCAAYGESQAAWDNNNSSYGYNGSFIFNGTSYASSAFYDWMHYGTYYVEPNYAWDSGYNDLAQNTVSYVVKSGSGLSVASSRAGRYVTLRAGVSYYSVAASAYRVWPGEKVVLQYRTCSTCTWMYLRNIYTASNGLAAYTFYAPSARYYRALSMANSTIWGRTSALMYR